jgi:hypothetical protein
VALTTLQHEAIGRLALPTWPCSLVVTTGGGGGGGCGRRACARVDARQQAPLPRGRSAAGSASPCQGEGRGFESRRPLGGSLGSTPDLQDLAMVVPGCSGGMAEWLRQGPAKPCTRVRFPLPPRAISSVGERFVDTEEVTGSIPVSPTSSGATSQRWTWPLFRPGVEDSYRLCYVRVLRTTSSDWPSSSAEGRPRCSRPGDQLSTRIWNG